MSGARSVVLFYFVFVLFALQSLALKDDTVYISVIDSTRIVDGETFPSYSLQGNGTNWKDLGGIYGYVIPPNSSFSVVYTNSLDDEETIVHAHGLTPPSPLDGVPYLSAVPIFPQRSEHYEYTLNQHTNQGTYFLHSHFGFQFGNGAVAPLIIEGIADNYPLNPIIEQSVDVVMLLEDLCPSASGEYERKLNQGLDLGFATPRADINRDYEGGAGDCSSWKTFLELAYDFNTTWYTPNGFSCSELEPATDSDVLYTKYLANGNTFNSPRILSGFSFETPIRYRVINAAGMTNFQLVFPFEVTLITTDGQWVNPFSNTTFWISVAQRMDFLVQIPSDYDSSYITITAWTENYVLSTPTPMVLSSFSLITEEYENEINSDVKKLADSGYATGMMNNHLELELEAYFPLEHKAADVVEQILLTGDNGFRGINHHSYRLPPTEPLPYQPNPYPLLVNYGDRVQLQIQNQNADGHPMHLHGHSFQITNIDGTKVNGAMRDVAFVPGGCHNVTVEFDALNPGLWAFHCHLEFHLAAGMLTTVEYQ